MNTEKDLEMLKAEKKRLLYWTFVPYVCFVVFVLALQWPSVRGLIAPLSVATAVIILCAIDMAIVIPIVMKIHKIEKRMKKITDENPELKLE